MKKVFHMNDVRDIFNKLKDEEISMSKALEMMNKKVDDSVPKWLPADGELLPEIGKQVLGFVVLGDHRYIEIVKIDTITLMEGGRRSIDWQNKDYYDPGVTHWMPLPENPEISE